MIPLIVAAGTLAAGLAYAQQEPARVTGADALVKEEGRFKETWVHPDANIKQYSKLYVWRPAFQFRDVGEKGGGTTSSMLQSGGPYPVDEEEMKKFEEVVVNVFLEELQRSETFELVNEIGPDTLIVRGGVLDIISKVPPRTRAGNAYLSAVGEGTFIIELIDSETGLMQARIGERRRIQPPGTTQSAFSKPANAATIWADVEQWARGFASDLRRELEKAKK
jgi:hypothetical protein